MSPEEIQRLKEFAENATGGPWEVVVEAIAFVGHAGENVIYHTDSRGEKVEVITHPGLWDGIENKHEIHEDAAFIAAANPSVILALIEELDAYRAALEDYALGDEARDSLAAQVLDRRSAHPVSGGPGA